MTFLLALSMVVVQPSVAQGLEAEATLVSALAYGEYDDEATLEEALDGELIPADAPLPEPEPYVPAAPEPAPVVDDVAPAAPAAEAPAPTTPSEEPATPETPTPEAEAPEVVPADDEAGPVAEDADESDDAVAPSLTDDEDAISEDLLFADVMALDADIAPRTAGPLTLRKEAGVMINGVCTMGEQLDGAGYLWLQGGQDVCWRFTIHNTGDEAANNISLSDSFETGRRPAAPGSSANISAPPGTTVACTGNTAWGGGLCNADTLGPDQTIVIEVHGPVENWADSSPAPCMLEGSNSSSWHGQQTPNQAGDVADWGYGNGHWVCGDGSWVINESTVTSSNAAGDSDRQAIGIGDYQTVPPPVGPPPAPDLSVQKTAVDEAFAGSQIAWRVTVANTGQGNATNVTVTDTIPAGVTVTSASPGCTPSSGVGSFVMTCTLASLGSGQSHSFDIVATIDPNLADGTELVNTATVTSPEDPDNPPGNSVTVVHNPDPIWPVFPPVPPTPNLSIQKTAPDEAFAGSRIGWQLTVANTGNGDATDVTVTDTIPAGVTVTSAPAECTPNSGVGSFVMTCHRDSLASGDTWNIQIEATIDPNLADGTKLENTATVTSPEDPDNPPGGSVTEVHNPDPIWPEFPPIPQTPNLSIQKTAPDEAFAGSRIGWQLTVANTGNGDATDVTVTDTIPAGVTVTSAPPECTPNSGVGSFVMTCTLDRLAGNGGTWNIQIEATIDPDLADGTKLENTATVTSPEDPDNPPGNSVTVVHNPDPIWPEFPPVPPTEPQPEPNLQIDKVAVDEAFAGSRIGWRIRVANTGQGDATDVTVEDTIPAGVTVTSAPPECTPNSGVGEFVMTCTLDRLAGNGGTWEIPIEATIDPDLADGTKLENTATVTSPEDPNNPPGNSVTEVHNPDPEWPVFPPIPQTPNLSIQKTAVDEAFAGSRIGWLLTVANTGNADATDVTVTDTIPAGVTVTSAPPECTPNSGVGSFVMTCHRDRLAGNGGTWNIQIEATIDPDLADGTKLENTATVTSPEDPNNPPGNSVTVVHNPDPEWPVFPPIPSHPHLWIRKDAADLDGQTFAGSRIGWLITIGNNGRVDATDVTVTDDIPAGVTVTSISDVTGSSDGCTPTDLPKAGPFTMTCHLEDLASGGSAQFRIEATVDPDYDASELGDLVNVAVVDSPDDPDGPYPGESVTIVNDLDPLWPEFPPLSPNLWIRKSAPAEANAGDSLTWLLVVGNSGTGNASDVTVTDDIPTGVTVTSAPEECAPRTGVGPFVMTCSFANLASGGSQVFSIQATIDPDYDVTELGELVNNVSVTYPGDPNDPRHDDSVTVVVPPVVPEPPAPPAPPEPPAVVTPPVVTPPTETQPPAVVTPPTTQPRPSAPADTPSRAGERVDHPATGTNILRLVGGLAILAAGIAAFLYSRKRGLNED